VSDPCLKERQQLQNNLQQKMDQLLQKSAKGREDINKRFERACEENGKLTEEVQKAAEENGKYAGPIQAAIEENAKLGEAIAEAGARAPSEPYANEHYWTTVMIPLQQRKDQHWETVVAPLIRAKDEHWANEVAPRIRAKDEHWANVVAPLIEEGNRYALKVEQPTYQTAAEIQDLIAQVGTMSCDAVRKLLKEVGPVEIPADGPGDTITTPDPTPGPGTDIPDVGTITDVGDDRSEPEPLDEGEGFPVDLGLGTAASRAAIEGEYQKVKPLAKETAEAAKEAWDKVNDFFAKGGKADLTKLDLAADAAAKSDIAQEAGSVFKKLDGVAKALDGAGTALTVADQMKRSSAGTTGGKATSGVLAGVANELGYGMNPYLGVADAAAGLILEKGFGVKGVTPSQVVNQSIDTAVTFGEAAITGDTSSLQELHEKNLRGENGPIWQSAAEAGEYWEEHGIVGGMEQFLQASAGGDSPPPASSPGAMSAQH
jgi:hypothetical protein